MAPTRSRNRSGLWVAGLVLCLALAAAAVRPGWPVLAQTADLPAAGVVIAEDSLLRVRSGPGTDYDILDRLEPGAAVQVLAVSDDGMWYRISAGGVEGWAAVEFIRIGDASAADDTASAPLLLPTPTPVAGEEPRVPAAPAGEEGPVSVLALLAPPATPTTAAQGLFGDQVEAEEDGTFVLAPTATPAPVEEAPAAVPAETVAETVAAAPVNEVQAEAADAAAPSIPMAMTQPARMNVRGGPGTGFTVVVSVPQGTSLEITGKTQDGQWYRVKLDGQESPGWVFAGLTTPAGPLENVPALAPEELPAPPMPELAEVQSAAPPIVSAPPPSGGGSFGYGVQAHLLAGQAGSAMTAISDMGFNWVKQQVEWRIYQPQPGPIGFGELEGIVGAANSRGISVLFSVVNAPEWAREPGFDGGVGGPPQDPNTYAAFVGAMAGQFCNSALKAIEIWNEQNLHYEWGNKPLDPAEYMNLLKAAYGAIKTACPSMLVISGALTPAGSNPPYAVDDFAYLEGMYQNGLANYADGIGAHPSGYNVPASVRWEDACATIQQTGNSFNGACDTPHHSWSFRSTMEGYRNIMNVYGDSNKRIWPTEFGWAAGGAFDPRYAYANDNSYDEQAAWTVEAYTMMRDWGWVGPAFLWNLNFRVVADGTEKAQWGIVRNDWSPLPVYQALQAMAK